MRLIDADELEKLHCEYCNPEIRSGCKEDPVCASLWWVKDAPTVEDAVKVVRCKDCEFWNPISGIRSNGECKCGNLDLSYGAVLYTKEDDYCSRGLFKEG